MKKLFILGALSAGALLLLSYLQSRYSTTIPAALDLTNLPVLNSAFNAGVSGRKLNVTKSHQKSPFTVKMKTIATLEPPTLHLSRAAKTKLVTREARRRILALKDFYDPEQTVGAAQAAVYRGKLQNYLSGLVGVAKGGQAIVNIPLDQRIHEIDLQCVDWNYTGAAVVPTIVTAGGFSNTTGTCKIVVSTTGVVSITYAAGNSAGATTSTVLQVPDPTGPPVTLTCTAAGTGALGNATFAITGAAPGPIDPRDVHYRHEDLGQWAKSPRHHPDADDCDPGGPRLPRRLRHAVNPIHRALAQFPSG